MQIGQYRVQNFIYKAGEAIGSPQQRLIIGLTALVTQPIIDLHNKEVDKDSRVLAATKSVAKTIAGTTSGVLVRAACIKVAEYLTKEGHLFDPKKFIHDESFINVKKTKNFCGTLGTFAAIGVMLGTNFLWDAPVTKALTNAFSKFIKGKEDKNEKSSS